ncbi:MAG: major facilitator superfamily protein [Frankiales bacterium]|nr:major facilitator superfamily protein [Frankiales bacterium]
MRTRGFWGISAAQTLAALAPVGGLTHLNTLVSGRSPASVAGAALSCVAIGSLSGRLLGRVVLSRTSTSGFFRLLLLVQAGALVVLALGRGTGVLLGAALVFGLTIGNVLLVHPLLLAEVFGLRDFARVLSASGLVATGGIACGPLVVGLLRDSTGSYTAGYLAAASASLLGAVLLHLTPTAAVSAEALATGVGDGAAVDADAR